jgi:hypothetical protein
MADVPNTNTRKTAATPPKSERIVSREDNNELSKCTGAELRQRCTIVPKGKGLPPRRKSAVTERPAQIILGQEFDISPGAIANGDRRSHRLPVTVAQTAKEGFTVVTGGEEICRHLERCLATPHEVETGLSGVVLAALLGQSIQLVRESDSWLSRLSQGKPGNGEEPRRRTKHRKSNNNSNAPEPCKNNIRNYGQSYTGGSDRASLYKKDLYRKNRAGLAEVISLAETVKARMPSLRNVAAFKNRRHLPMTLLSKQRSSNGVRVSNPSPRTRCATPRPAGAIRLPALIGSRLPPSKPRMT